MLFNLVNRELHVDLRKPAYNQAFIGNVGADSLDRLNVTESGDSKRSLRFLARPSYRSADWMIHGD